MNTRGERLIAIWFLCGSRLQFSGRHHMVVMGGHARDRVRERAFMGAESDGRYDVTIVGGGLSGLTAALQLRKDQLSVCILEESDEVGGRVRTDEQAGFLLDRGFQVFLT